MLARLGWRLCAAGQRKLLDEFLLARALEHDAPGILLQRACDWLRAERIVRPPVDSLTRRVATARDAARAETYHRLGPLLQPPRPMQLDGLLDVDPDLGMTRLAWLRRGASVATPELLKAELHKLEFLRRYGADHLDLSRLPVGRRRMLAEIGRRATNQAQTPYAALEPKNLPNRTTRQLCTRPLTTTAHRHLGHPNFTASPNITPSALRSRFGNGRWLGRLTEAISWRTAVA